MRFGRIFFFGLVILVFVMMLSLSLSGCGVAYDEDGEVMRRTMQDAGIEKFIDHEQHNMCYYKYTSVGVGLSCVPLHGYR